MRFENNSPRCLTQFFQVFLQQEELFFFKFFSFSCQAEIYFLLFAFSLSYLTYFSITIETEGEYFYINIINEFYWYKYLPQDMQTCQANFKN